MKTEINFAEQIEKLSTFMTEKSDNIMEGWSMNGASSKNEYPVCLVLKGKSEDGFDTNFVSFIDEESEILKSVLPKKKRKTFSWQDGTIRCVIKEEDGKTFLMRLSFGASGVSTFLLDSF